MGETLDLRPEVWQVINGAISDDPSNHEIWQATDAVLAIINRYVEALEVARVELARWGWGDMHYPEQPQEKSVVDTLAVIDAVLRPVAPLPAAGPEPEETR